MGCDRLGLVFLCLFWFVFLRGCIRKFHTTSSISEQYDKLVAESDPGFCKAGGVEAVISAAIVAKPPPVPGPTHTDILRMADPHHMISKNYAPLPRPGTSSSPSETYCCHYPRGKGNSKSSPTRLCWGQDQPQNSGGSRLPPPCFCFWAGRENPGGLGKEGGPRPHATWLEELGIFPNLEDRGKQGRG